MRWVGNGPYMDDRRDRVVVEKGEERIPLEDLGKDVMVVLKLVLKKRVGMWTGLIWPRTGASGLLL
jgi:hypothetical protein